MALVTGLWLLTEKPRIAQIFFLVALGYANRRKYFDEKDDISLRFTQGKRENHCLLNSKNLPVFTYSMGRRMNGRSPFTNRFWQGPGVQESGL